MLCSINILAFIVGYLGSLVHDYCSSCCGYADEFTNTWVGCNADGLTRCMHRCLMSVCVLACPHRLGSLSATLQCLPGQDPFQKGSDHNHLAPSPHHKGTCVGIMVSLLKRRCGAVYGCKQPLVVSNHMFELSIALHDTYMFWKKFINNSNSLHKTCMS